MSAPVVDKNGRAIAADCRIRYRLQD